MNPAKNGNRHVSNNYYNPSEKSASILSGLESRLLSHVTFFDNKMKNTGNRSIKIVGNPIVFRLAFFI